MGLVGGIAGKKLISSIPAQNHFDILGCEFREEVGRKYRGIGQGFVQDVRKHVQALEHFLHIKHLELVLDIEGLGDLPRIPALVKRRFVKAYRETFHLRVCPCGESGNKAGVNAPA